MRKFVRLFLLVLLFCVLISSICACDEYLETDYGNDKNVPEATDITITKDKDDLIGKNYKEVEEYFKNLGFTNIEFSTYVFDEGVVDGEVTDITIVDWIFKETEFSNGNTFSSDCKIKISYNKLKEEETSDSLFYSTNNYEKAKEGKTGVFSYKNKKGSYDVYWIIDFDNGYVYFFTDGNNESTCDKLKIVSGDLNDRITIKWDKDTIWYLHFKYVEHPETLVVNDHLSTSTEFTTTKLSDALNIRANKTICEW